MRFAPATTMRSCCCRRSGTRRSSAAAPVSRTTGAPSFTQSSPARSQTRLPITTNAGGWIPGGRSIGRSRRVRMTAEAQNRVQIAASHWRPRFTANGIDINDFDRTVSSTIDWKDWGPNWLAMGDAHLALAEEAIRAKRTVTATDAYQRAAWCYHLGKFLWFEDRDLHQRLHRLTVDTYAKALPHLEPAGERVEVPFERAVIPGILRRPRDAALPPLVILVPGLDSVKEELYAIENEFLRRGLATLSVDGPGQGENAPRFPIRPDWASVIGPLLDGLRGRRDVDLNR